MRPSTPRCRHRAPGASRRTPIHPLWMRINHWLHALAVLLLVTSGWRLYDTSPFFAFRLPAQATLGGWLGGALQWHFAAMWLLAANGLVYLSCNNCKNALPHVTEWHRKYKDQGLVVIGVHSPEFAFEKSIPNVEARARRAGRAVSRGSRQRLRHLAGLP